MTVIAITCRRWRSLPESQGTAIGVLSDYVDALVSMGAGIVLIPFQKPSLALSALERCDGLLLTGGEDVATSPRCSEGEAYSKRMDRARDEFEHLLLRYARECATPVLGICRGLHLLNMAFGGTISRLAKTVSTPVRHTTEWRKGEVYVHEVTLLPDSRLRSIMNGVNCIRVNGSHEYCVNAIGRGLRVSAYSPDGVVEAVEATDGTFCFGIQWHPECLVHRGDPHACALFKAFLDACSEATSPAPHGRRRHSLEEET